MRITDYIGLGVMSKSFPAEAIEGVLARTGTASLRQRDLPAHVVVYYVIAPALYMQSSYREVLRCLLEGLQWLRDSSARLRVAGKSGISQARTRLGWEPLRQLHDELVQPMAVRGTRGAWYREWRLVSLPSRCTRCPPQTGRLSRYSPLGRRRHFMKPFSTKSSRNASSPAAIGAIPAA